METADRIALHASREMRGERLFISALCPWRWRSSLNLMRETRHPLSDAASAGNPARTAGPLPPGSESTLIRPIQYLRGLACMVVVLVHALSMIPGVEIEEVGTRFFSGIEMLFLISGFVMVVTLAKKDRTPLEFLKIRIVRIVPLYWIATLATIALRSFDHLYYSPENIAKSLLFVPYAAVPGQPGSIWPVLQQGWTLNYEMFFYVLFALALTAPRRFLVPALASVLITLVAVGRLFGPFVNPLAMVYTSALLLPLTAGMIVAYLWLRDRAQNWLRWSPLFIVFGLYCIVVPHSWGVILGGTFIIFASCLHPKLLATQSRPLLELGNASYSIYLFHHFVLLLLSGIWLRMFPLTWVSSALFLLLALILCVAAGWLCYVFIELPLTSRLLNLLRNSPRQSLPQAATPRAACGDSGS
jgi:exopolysaccharide production protein ExoZ